MKFLSRLIVMLILVLSFLGVQSAFADSHAGFSWNENQIRIRYDNHTVSFTPFLFLEGQGNTITDLIIETIPTDNLQLINAECIRYDGKTGVTIPISKPYDGKHLDLSDITFQTGEYFFVFNFKIVSHKTEFIGLNCIVNSYTLNKQTHVIDIMDMDCNMADLFIVQPNETPRNQSMNVPKTGDTSTPAIYMALMTASALVLRRIHSLL